MKNREPLMLKTIKVLSVPIVSSLCLSLAYASPTSNEFTPCKKGAILTLEFCLNENSHNRNKACWTKSKESYDSCAKKVIQRHDPKIKEAKRKAAAKAKSDQTNLPQ